MCIRDSYRTGNNSSASFPTGQANNSSAFFSYKTGIKPHIDTRAPRVSTAKTSTPIRRLVIYRAPCISPSARQLSIYTRNLRVFHQPSKIQTSIFSHLASRDEFLPYQARRRALRVSLGTTQEEFSFDIHHASSPICPPLPHLPHTETWAPVCQHGSENAKNAPASNPP